MEGKTTGHEEVGTGSLEPVRVHGDEYDFLSNFCICEHFIAN